MCSGGGGATHRKLRQHSRTSRTARVFIPLQIQIFPVGIQEKEPRKTTRLGLCCHPREPALTTHPDELAAVGTKLGVCGELPSADPRAVHHDVRLSQRLQRARKQLFPNPFTTSHAHTRALHPPPRRDKLSPMQIRPLFQSGLDAWRTREILPDMFVLEVESAQSSRSKTSFSNPWLYPQI